MIKKLERRLVLVATAVLAAVLILTLTVVNLVNYTHITAKADRTLSYIAEHDGQIPEVGTDKRPYHEKKPPEGDDGKTPPPSDFSPETPFSTRYFTVSKTAESTTVNTEHIAAIDRETAILYAEAIAEGKSVGYYHQYRYLVTLTEDGIFYAFLDCENDLRNFNSFLKNSIFLGLAGMVVVFLLILLFSGIAVKPFEKAYAGQKRFVTDASHELKTPLTVIRSAGEVIAMEHGEDEWTETIRHQIDRLSALTDKLVFLARMDEGQGKLQTYEFSVSDVAIEVTQAFRTLSRAKAIPFLCEIEPGRTVTGDESLMGTLISLLLDNAFKYASPNGEIRFTLAAKGKHTEITVSNPVDQAPTEDLNLLFERFYRPDASRSSATGGFGIGLAQAQSIVLAHKGKIGVKYENGLIRFTVILP